MRNMKPRINTKEEYAKCFDFSFLNEEKKNSLKKNTEKELRKLFI